MPLLIGQGAADPLVLPDVQAAYTERLCDAEADYRTYEGGSVRRRRRRLALLPDLITWTQQRLNGDLVISTRTP